jgi:hypothetical protein
LPTDAAGEGLAAEAPAGAGFLAGVLEALFIDATQAAQRGEI